MAEPLHLTVIIKDDRLRTTVGAHLAHARGQEHIHTFRTRDEFDKARFGGPQLFQVDRVIVAHADAPSTLASHIGEIKESAPDAHIIVVRRLDEAFELENVDCVILPLDASLPERVDRVLQTT